MLETSEIRTTWSGSTTSTACAMQMMVIILHMISMETSPVNAMLTLKYSKRMVSGRREIKRVRLRYANRDVTMTEGHTFLHLPFGR